MGRGKPRKESPKRRKRQFIKFKLLLDEGLPIRQALPKLNSLHNVKHIKHDLGLGGTPDEKVYEIASKEKRILITFDYKGFKKLIVEDQSGIIAVSARLSTTDLDKKICSLLSRSTEKSLMGKIIKITGETKF